MTSSQIKLQIPKKFQPLLDKIKRYRFYVYYGGRGGAKSWSIARCLIILAYSEKKRILCTREYQRSIADSVHKLLKDQIAELGLSNFFRITDDKIISLTTGSEFIFRGLHANSTEIKSLEGVDIVWIEEAQSITSESLGYLIPTIRKAGSEIWISFNTKYESDPVYQFVNNPRENSFVQRVNIPDNPYATKELLDEMEHDRVTNYDLYRCKWLGEPEQISDAVIFKGKYSVKQFETHPNAEFLFGADYGYSNDPSTLVRCYELKEGNELNLYIDHEAYGLYNQNNIQGYYDYLTSLYRTVPLSDKYVVNCDCARPEIIEHHKRTYNRLFRGEPKLKVESGISYLLNYHHIYIHPRCIHTIDEFGKYSYKLDGSGNPTSIPADKDNHLHDSIRYALFYKIKSKSEIKFSNGNGLNI